MACSSPSLPGKPWRACWRCFLDPEAAREGSAYHMGLTCGPAWLGVRSQVLGASGMDTSRLIARPGCVYPGASRRSQAVRSAGRPRIHMPVPPQAEFWSSAHRLGKDCAAKPQQRGPVPQGTFGELTQGKDQDLGSGPWGRWDSTPSTHRGLERSPRG